MLKVILFLAICALYCAGQRRWAGSYSRTYSEEDRFTWDDSNYRRSDKQTTTEGNIRYDHGEKWPADNWKGQGVYDVTSPRNPPMRRDEYDPRMDERPRDDPVSGVSEIAKVYHRMPDPSSGRQDNHPMPEDDYDRRKLDRPVIVNEEKYYPVDDRKGEDRRENRQRDIPKIEKTSDTRRYIATNKGDIGEMYGEPLQNTNRKRFQSVPTESRDNRQRDDINYKGYEETSEMQRPKADRTQQAAPEFTRTRDKPKIVVHQDDTAERRNSRSNRNGQRERPREDEIGGIASYDRTVVESEHKIHKLDVHDTRQQTGNNKGDIGKSYEEQSQDSNQKRFQPASTEDYNNRERDNINYKGHDEASQTQYAAREYIRPIDKPRTVMHQDSTAESRINRGNRNEQRSIFREDKIDDIVDYDKTKLESKQNQDERHVPAQSKGDIGYGYDRQHEKGLRAREYDRRREEELKRREYERRLEEEIRKKGEERDEIRIKGIGYNIKQEEVVGRNYGRRQEGMNNTEYYRREGQGIKGTMEERKYIKGIESNRHQEEQSGHGNISKVMEEIKGRNFEINQESSKESNYDDLRKEKGIEERSFRRKEEEARYSTYDLTYKGERRPSFTEGTDNIGIQDRGTNRREIIRDKDTGEENVKYSERGQEERIERRPYSGSGNAKGEAYDREIDRIVKTSNRDHRLSLSRDYSDGTQRPATINDRDLRLVVSTLKGNQRRQDNNKNRNRVTEHPLIQDAAADTLRPVENSQRKEGNLRSHERGYNNTSFNHSDINQRRNININQRTSYDRNSKEALGINFKSTVSRSYAEVNDRHVRTNTRKEESLETFPNYKQRTLPDEETVRRVDHFVHPIYSDKDIRNSSSSPANSKSNIDQQTNDSNSWKQSFNNSWKSTNGPTGIYGYHRNVSYDIIVFLDDEIDDEMDVFNLSNRNDKEPSHVVNDEQNNYKGEYRGQVINVRENQRKITQHNRNERNRTFDSRATEYNRRNKRSSEEYLVQEARIRFDSLPQMQKPIDIHPDVEILPGYGTTKQFGHRGYSDDVTDDEVELFSSREIKVNTKDYRTNGTTTITNKNIADKNQTISNKTSLQGIRYEKLQARTLMNDNTQSDTLNRKDNSQIARRTLESDILDETPSVDPISLKYTSPTSVKTDSSNRSPGEELPLPENRKSKHVRH